MNFFTATKIATTSEPCDKYETGERWISLYIGKTYNVIDSVLTVIRDSENGQIREAYFSACSIDDAPNERNTMMLPSEVLGSVDDILAYVESTIPPEIKAMMELIETVNSIATDLPCGDPKCDVCRSERDDESF